MTEHTVNCGDLKRYIEERIKAVGEDLMAKVSEVTGRNFTHPGDINDSVVDDYMGKSDPDDNMTVIHCCGQLQELGYLARDFDIELSISTKRYHDLHRILWAFSF